MELAKIKAWDLMWKNVNNTWKKYMQKYLEEALQEFKENFFYVEMQDENEDTWQGVRVPRDKDDIYIEMLNEALRRSDTMNMFGSTTINKLIKKMLSPVDFSEDGY